MHVAQESYWWIFVALRSRYTYLIGAWCQIRSAFVNWALENPFESKDYLIKIREIYFNFLKYELCFDCSVLCKLILIVKSLWCNWLGVCNMFKYEFLDRCRTWWWDAQYWLICEIGISIWYWVEWIKFGMLVCWMKHEMNYMSV